jgi:hypothetical protein
VAKIKIGSLKLNKKEIMEDFYFILKQALESGRIRDMVAELNGDNSLDYRLSDSPVTIGALAYYKSLSDFNSLEHIYERTKKTNLEIPYVNLIDEQKMTITETIRGSIGSQGLCDWHAGSLLRQAFNKTLFSDLKICLGHTHPVIYPESGPVRKYGALCSRIIWRAADLRDIFIAQGDKIAEVMLDSGLCKKYGADYCEMLIRTKLFAPISKYASIMSPRTGQFGLFEIKDDGVVEYHPWQLQS